MALSKEQKRDLNQLSEYFKKIEKISVENSIDLDVFMTEYSKDGFAIYATEKIGLNTNTNKRKTVFEKAGKEKSKISTRNQ